MYEDKEEYTDYPTIVKRYEVYRCKKIFIKDTENWKYLPGVTLGMKPKYNFSVYDISCGTPVVECNCDEGEITTLGRFLTKENAMNFIKRERLVSKVERFTGFIRAVEYMIGWVKYEKQYGVIGDIIETSNVEFVAPLKG